MAGINDSLGNITLARGLNAMGLASLTIDNASGTYDPLVGGLELDLKLTKQDIAEMVGTTVETAIRTMSKFKKLGYLEEKSGKIIIKDSDGLRPLE